MVFKSFFLSRPRNITTYTLYNWLTYMKTWRTTVQRKASLLSEVQCYYSKKNIDFSFCFSFVLPSKNIHISKYVKICIYNQK